MGLVDCNIKALQLLHEHAPAMHKYIKVNFQTGCWEWIGKLNRNGYGRSHWRHPVAHRMIYDFFLGFEGEKLNKDQVLDHVCRCRSCVNSAHLEPVAIRENTHRGQAVLFRKGEVNEAQA